jgi:hypothetical protein
MIHLLTTVEHQRIAWLPQFVQHYQKLGVQRFWITIHFDPSVARETVSSAMRRARGFLTKEGITYLNKLVCPFDAMALRANHDSVQAEVAAHTDWIVWADIDEFQVYPMKLSKCIRESKNIGATVISGEFIDRVAPDGRLIHFNPKVPIWKQFPIGCDITKRILIGQTNKVVCSQAHIKIKHANHDPVRGQGGISWLPHLAAVHHFKWDITVVERLKPRLRSSWKRRCPWWVQSKRFMDHLREFKKINLSLLNTIYFPGGGQGTIDEEVWSFVRGSREGLLKAGDNLTAKVGAAHEK